MSRRHLPRPPWLRRAIALAGLTSLAAGLVLLPAASCSAAQVSTHNPQASGQNLRAGRRTSAVTVTGPHLYNPATGKQFPFPSKVTVSQTANLVSQLVHVSWSGFTPTGGVQPGQPYYQVTLNYTVMVAECRGTHPVRWSDCYGAANAGIAYPTGAYGPYNTAYANSTAKGTGQIPFAVQTGDENKLVGCDPRHPCSLVVVPGQGGIPASGGIPANCKDHSADLGISGEAAPGQTFNSITGGCSWRDRIVIPLRFAPVPSGCPLRNAAFSAAGSPMLSSAMQQWMTGLCAGRHGLTINFNSQDGEQLAVGQAVSGLADVALTTRPASAQGVSTGNRHFVYAPVAVSAASIAYWIDNSTTGQPLSGLRLNQRLLAKLLTTSYAATLSCTFRPKPPNCDNGVDNNPSNIFTDPEFARLDRRIDRQVVVPRLFLSGQQYEIPTVASGPSDLTWTVTRWIGASPPASKFLAGTFDPFGMHVNTYYVGLKYPVDAFAAQDPTLLYSLLYHPVFPFGRVVTFQALNSDAGTAFQSFINGKVVYTQDHPEPVGSRDLFAVVDQGDAALNQFPVAAIPNTAGRYLTPSSATMAAALRHMISDGNGTLQVNLANSDPHAYPLTMVIYAMAPTSGLSHAKAAAIAHFIDFAAGPGQTPGVRPGQLPPGYLPLTPRLRAQARKAAAEVLHQTGATTATPSPSPSPTPSPTPSVAGTPSPSPGSASPQPSVSLPGATLGPVRMVAVAHPRTAALTRFALPAMLILGGLAALGGSFAFARSEGLGARLRRGARTAAAWSRYLRGESRWGRKP